MHRILKAALPEAIGRSEFVIVVVADVRGFSAFSHKHESPDIAMYIKCVYMKLIDGYFPDASFYKTTGDGLLVTIPYNEKNLAEVAQRTVESCLVCVDQFGSISQGDQMINFPTPDKVGFGLARGTCCCLISEDKVLDYSGHLLNLATQLMGLARPSGLVLDGAFGIGLLKTATQQLFDEAEVYLRGLAEELPVKVHYLKGRVEIPDDAKQPLAEERWKSLSTTAKLYEWERLAPRYRIDLPTPLQRSDSAVVTLYFPDTRKGKTVKGIRCSRQLSGWKYVLTGTDIFIGVNVAEFIELLRGRAVPRTATVELKVDYVPKKQ